jgi:hypothetical protein
VVSWPWAFFKFFISALILLLALTVVIFLTPTDAVKENLQKCLAAQKYYFIPTGWDGVKKY